MKTEPMKVTGAIKFELRDKDGLLKDSREVHNVITTAGKTYLAAWLAAASQAGKFMSYVGLGTGTDAADAGDTDIKTPFSPVARSLGVLTSATNVWQSVSTFDAGTCTGAITEAGVFSASTSGTLMAHQVFSVINKGASDSLVVTWQVTFS
jgi:hypothetical protein